MAHRRWRRLLADVGAERKSSRRRGYPDRRRRFYCIFFALQDTTPQNGGTLYLPWGSSAVVAPDLPAGSVVIFDQMPRRRADAGSRRSRRGRDSSKHVDAAAAGAIHRNASTPPPPRFIEPRVNVARRGVLHRVGDNQGPPPGRPESIRWLAFQGLYSGTHDGDNPSVSQEDGYGSAFVDADYETAEALE